MSRWLVLLIIGALVVTGLHGCVLVVTDENTAHDIQIERNRSSLARDIAEDLEQDDSLNRSDIRVTEDDGVVTLHGDVDNVSSLQHAVDLVARYSGVETIVSHLTVVIEL